MLNIYRRDVLVATQQDRLTKNGSVRTRPLVKFVRHKICMLYHKAKRGLVPAL